MYFFKNSVFSLLMLFAAVLGGGKAYLDHRLRAEFNQWISSVAPRFTVDYSELKTTLLGNLIINQLVITVPKTIPIHIDTMTISSIYQFYRLKSLPKQIVITVQNLNFPIGDSNPPIPILMKTLGYAPYYLSDTMIKKLGYFNFKADLTCETHLFEKETDLSVTLEAGEWGKLELHSRLKHDPLFEKSAMDSIQLSDLTLNYTDKGIINRILTFLAQRDSKSLEDFKRGLTQKISKDIEQLGLTIDDSVLTSLDRFINTPSRLSLFLQPNPPLFLNQFNTIRFEQLGLRMTTL